MSLPIRCYSSSRLPLESITTHDQYHNAGLSKSDLPRSPISLFHAWFEEAKKADILAPETMTLSTASLMQGSQGITHARPSSRVVLLKTLDQRGFIFFTNYSSRKSGELQSNPWCSLTFYYDQPLHRSVRVCGKAEKLGTDESQAYFDTRPLGSRIGAHASPQSQVISDRRELEERVQSVEHRFEVPGAAGLHGAPPPDEGKKIPVPEYWGGWRVIPDEIEFWLGRENRLHDRFRYTRSLESAKDAADDTWQLDQLAP
ncbi:pyridoxamine 5'-phosphate oxidase [Ceraceosorus guamensis]|uniref:pyridoxal 5'-phosphate synthase n=1 Tax=Ceraceosorus guamensis TaxID=1522189 RepID=A0A316W779_9BASI|nr:pyridoxamine 5'-phosphate oxidase [Ceraceosorus guamensis]PWN44988.1 pyridoxamine 5'-phosphate oxidase [Ceraceosorus guamensis]